MSKPGGTVRFSSIFWIGEVDWLIFKSVTKTVFEIFIDIHIILIYFMQMCQDANISYENVSTSNMNWFLKRKGGFQTSLPTQAT